MDVRDLRRRWQDEGNSAYIYRLMADHCKSEDGARVFRRLARIEERHQRVYGRMIEEQGQTATGWSPSGRTKIMKYLLEHGQQSLVLSLRVAANTRQARGYLRTKHRQSTVTGSEFDEIAREELHHAKVLSQLTGSGDEPWHQTNSGGILRNVIYGFNDGLTANFGLIMGALGASLAPSAVLLTGLSGMIADALSMGGSGFLAAKSEQEVWANEIEMEREEIRLIPESETQELALRYQAKGMSTEVSVQAAAQVMAETESALHEKVREELGVSVEPTPPIREGFITGLATAVGAMIPMVAFFFETGPAALWTSFATSMIAHFVVGAARSIFTGRGVIRSGTDMFVVGLGVAGLGYLFGSLISGHL